MVQQLGYLSSIAHAEREISDFIDENRARIRGKLDAVFEKRRALRDSARDAGLRIEDFDAGLLDDLRGVDDSGRLIECNFKIKVLTQEEVKKAVLFCKEHNLLALPIGARTSALGVFEAFSVADKKAFDGVMGIQVESLGMMDKFSKADRYEVEVEGKDLSEKAQLLQVPHYDEAHYELIRDCNYPIGILKSKTFPEDPTKPHRVLAHAGMTVDNINEFLRAHLGNDERYMFRIMPDPTSRKEAHLGGVASTGAEGGNRAKASEDILSTTMIDGNGEERHLDRDKSQLIIGANGNGGFLTQVEFEVTAFPKHEHALWVPISGEKQDVWRNMLKLQDSLRKHCVSQGGHRRLQIGEGEGGVIITGMEPLSKEALEIATLNNKDKLPGLGAAEFGLYITFNSFYPPEDAEKLLQEALGESLGFGEEAMEAFENSVEVEMKIDEAARALIDAAAKYDAAGSTAFASAVALFKVGQEFAASAQMDVAKELRDLLQQLEEVNDAEAATATAQLAKALAERMQSSDEDEYMPALTEAKTHNRFLLLPKEVRPLMDAVRHAAPDESRRKAKSLGDITQSTDMNIRIDSEDEAVRAQAMEVLSKLFFEYADSFPKELGFQVPIYGHMHPGVGEGGGIDPHIRIIFELSDPDSRWDAPEQVLKMKKRQRNLYRALLALHGTYGIHICTPEKSRFTNTEYWEWLCLTQPEEARRYLCAVKEYGYSKDAAGQPDRPVIGARVPHEMPGLLDRLPGGIRSLFNEDLIGAATGDEEMPAGLNPILKQFWPAILEISQLSHRGGTIKKLVGETLATMHEKFGLNENQYAFFIEDPLEAQSILERNFGADHAYLLKQLDVNLASLDTLNLSQDADSFHVLNITGLGLPTGLSILVSPHAAIRDAYERTVDGRNESQFRNLHTMWTRWPYETEETPNLPAIASLGLVLQSGVLGEQRGQSMDRIVTANPGPGQIHETILNGSEELFRDYLRLNTPDEQRKSLSMMKEFVGVPEEHSVATFTSATQIMQVLAMALKKRKGAVNVLQVTNDAFSERLYDVLVSELGKEGVHRVATPWTSSEHSNMDQVVDGLISEMKADQPNLIFVTPHKTSTTADFHPRRIVEALEARGKRHGRDYHLICDVTSGIGARDYATATIIDSGEKRIPYAGQFASFQKGMQQAPGFAMASFSPQLLEILGMGVAGDNNQEFGLAKSLHDACEGIVTNPMALAMLRQKLEADKVAGRTPEVIEQETRKKLALVLGWMQRHENLMPLVPNALDSSPLLVGIFSQAKNLTVAKRLVAEMGYIIGSGYKPFDKEALRLYLPNITEEKLKELLTALEIALESPDVIETRGEDVPNVALREPHDPLSVIERLSNEISFDDLFRDSVGLHWLERLVKTYNVGEGLKEGEKVRIGGAVPASSSGFDKKAKIYHQEHNRALMKRLFDLQNDEGEDVGGAYSNFLSAERHIRDLLSHHPDIRWEDTDPDAERVKVRLSVQLRRAQNALQDVSFFLRKYVDGNGSVDPAPRDEQGRVKWPVAA